MSPTITVNYSEKTRTSLRRCLNGILVLHHLNCWSTIYFVNSSGLVFFLKQPVRTISPIIKTY